MPFLQRERTDRAGRLEANMARADLAVSEKYRQIMEAYQIEAACGRAVATIDKIVAYTDGGPYYMRAARLNVQSANWTGAATSVEKALAAGADNPVQALVVLGTAHSEPGEYEQSIAAFRKVLESGNEEERRNAENWIEFVEEARAYRSAISATL